MWSLKGYLHIGLLRHHFLSGSAFRMATNFILNTAQRMWNEKGNFIPKRRNIFLPKYFMTAARRSSKPICTAWRTFVSFLCKWIYRNSWEWITLLYLAVIQKKICTSFEWCTIVPLSCTSDPVNTQLKIMTIEHRMLSAVSGIMRTS